MSCIILHDYEVFKHDVLFGCYIINNTKKELFQTWNIVEIRHFYEKHKNDIWMGWNNMYYDDLITEAIVEGLDPHKRSQMIINSSYKKTAKIHLLSYDLMNSCLPKPVGLKLTELISGKSIETTEVDFNLDRPLTDEEKRLTENYNKADLDQTYYNFIKFYDRFQLRLDIINEFKLPIKENLNATGTQIASNVLGAKHDYTLAYKEVRPTLYPTLSLKNKELLDFYLNEDFRKGIQKHIVVCGTKMKIGAGGAHHALKFCHFNKVFYADVSGYYNLIMIIFGLLSRAVPEKGKELYEHMYHQQLALKKKNPRKRAAFKTILLSVFGAQINKDTDLADPWHGMLVPITGQLFIVDLLEKLEGKITLVQCNTDGIIFDILDWSKEDEVVKIIEEWEERTGFVIKKEHKYNLWQRDVNNYVCVDENGGVEHHGQVFKNYDISDKAYGSGDIFDTTEPSIIAKGVLDYLIYNVSPEDTVEKYKSDLRNFQYACKKCTFDRTQYEVTNLKTNEITISKLQGVDRAFAYNSTEESGMIYKYKFEKKINAIKKAKVASLPPNVFIYNDDINSLETYEKLKDKIDYNYYVDRIYDKIAKFIGAE